MPRTLALTSAVIAATVLSAPAALAEPTQDSRPAVSDAAQLSAEAFVNLSCSPGNGTAAWNATAIDLRPNASYDTKFFVTLDGHGGIDDERIYMTSSAGNFTTNTFYTYAGFDTISVAFNVYDLDGRFVVSDSDSCQS